MREFYRWDNPTKGRQLFHQGCNPNWPLYLDTGDKYFCAACGGVWPQDFVDVYVMLFPALDQHILKVNRYNTLYPLGGK